MSRSWWMIACVSAVLGASALAPRVRDELQQLAHGFAERTDGTDLADKLLSPESVLDYAAAHPEQVAIASWEPGRQAQGLYLNPDRPQPMAAVSQLPLLGAYAAEPGASEQRVSLATWQRLVLPGPGSDAHLAALHDARALGALPPAAADAGDPAGVQASLPLSAVVRALVRHADPAAGDLLLERLGRTRVEALARDAGLAPDAAPLPQAGLPLSWLKQPGAPGAQPFGTEARGLREDAAAELLARAAALGAKGYADAAWQQLARLRQDDVFAASLRAQAQRSSDALSLRARAQLTAALPPRGSARALAALAAHLLSPASPGAQRLAELLESAPQRADIQPIGRLSGSQPGVLASVAFTRGQGGQPRVLALFFRDLPLAVWLRLSSSFLVQRLEAELLTDDALFAHARQRLAAGVARATSDLHVMHSAR